MELKDFIGAVVFSPHTKMHYTITQITAPEICVVCTTPNRLGYYPNYCYETINGDPFTNGYLVFENPALTTPFKAAYDAYCRTEDAYWENYDYWLHKSY